MKNRIGTLKETKRRAYQDRIVQVNDESLTGEVLLDEALRFIKTEPDSVANWIDLLSGETWNISKISYQLKQVRERISKGLVEKGILRTEKVSYILFDVPSHPVQDPSLKERLIQKVVDCLLNRGTAPDRKLVALICCAYAANVLENALLGLSHMQREAAFQKADELLQEYASFSPKVQATGTTEIMAGFVSCNLVFTMSFLKWTVFCN